MKVIFLNCRGFAVSALGKMESFFDIPSAFWAKSATFQVRRQEKIRKFMEKIWWFAHLEIAVAFRRQIKLDVLATK